MPITTYPFGGTGAFGVSQLPDMSLTLPITTGNYFFVSSVFGTDTPTNTTGLGTAVAPFATVQNAMTKTKANNYDVVVMMPGHTESISTPGYLTPVAGVALCGLGTGALRPTLTWTSPSCSIVCTANNLLFQNFVCVSGVAELITMFSISGFDCTINGVDVIEDASNHTCVTFLTSSGNRLSVLNCTHTNTTVITTTTAPGWINLIGGDSCKIWDNMIEVNRYNYATGGIITSSVIVTNISILRNTIGSMTSDGLTLAISLLASSTGIVAYNNCTNYGKSSNVTGTVGLANCFGTQNFATRTVTKSGKLDPAVDS